jgi:hypothetical protein
VTANDRFPKGGGRGEGGNGKLPIDEATLDHRKDLF